MWLQRFPIMAGVTIVSLVLAVACTADFESDGSVPAQASSTESAANPLPGAGEGEVVDMTPMSETELAAQPAGQSEPGAGAEGSQEEPKEEGEQPQPGEVVTYTDSKYGFSVSYPADFVFRTQPTEKLSQLKPKPTASFIIMNPVTASSDIVDLEPADLEIRIHGAAQIVSLESWLNSYGLLPADGTIPLQPFQVANVSGIKVCPSTMIVPNCSYFVPGKGWIYQFIPVTLEGEAMLDTFELIS
jgi:hypothetical protein